MIAVISILLIIIIIGLIALAFLGMSLGSLAVPFVSVSKEVHGDIIKALELKPGSVLCDIGSGNGKVLMACFDAHPQAEYIGIEQHIFPHLLAKYFLRKKGDPSQIKLIHGNIFNYTITNASHVFVYLLTSFLDTLLPKLEKELKKGTRLVSVDFMFTNKLYTKMIELPGAETRSRNKKLYIYEF